MLKKRIQNLINKELDARTIKDRPGLPIGYNPLEAIRRGLFHWVLVPFNGVDVWCELRCLNATQIRSCGDYSNILPKGSKEITRQNLIDLRNYQEKLIRLCLNRPTYDEIFKLVLNEDFSVKEKREELEEIKKIDLSQLPIKEKIELEKRIEEIELYIGFILPEDTFGFLTSWINGNDISDIKKLTDEQFLEAAILAVNGHDNPSDHFTGVFTDHNRMDIDKYAWNCLAEYQKNKGIEIHAKAAPKGRVIGGPKRG